QGNQREHPVDAFSNYWRGFNNLFYSCGTGPERDKIKRYIIQNITEEQSDNILQSFEKEIEYLLSEPVNDMRGNGRNTAQNINNYNETDNAITKLQEVFMVIYQVRCNLEHGQKSPSRKRDIHLCKCSLPFIAKAIEHNA
ncbi:hypothetical protein KAR91_13285, partial [Candidatus Pacearchaeota archaeon]|nr:hypothetical protein [Candidatus Pacearchaeota archaeon]